MRRIVLDQGLPATAMILRDAGWDAVHVREILMNAAMDGEILDYAGRESRVAITLDRDFPHDVIGEPGLSASSRPALNSDAYALWLDDVMRALSLDHASFVGVSLGGWLALDYATRRPRHVDRMALVCPGGVGRQKIGILFKIAFFNLFGKWGKRKLREAILGRMTGDHVSPALRKFGEFIALVRRSIQRVRKGYRSLATRRSRD